LKHATDKALDQLEGLLGELRRVSRLKEKKRGIFYLKAVAFVHFHEDPTGLFGDLRIENDFVRFAVNTSAERQAFLSRAKEAVAKFSVMEE
jgi:hypothetical protein